MKYKKWTIWINVIPITTRKNSRMIYPNEVLLEENVFGLPDESIALCHQIRTLDKRRFAQFYGEINDPKKQNEVIEALFFQFGIEPPYSL